MSLYLDPQMRFSFDEPPYQERREMLYAPAGPFGEAVKAWMDRERKRLKAQPALGRRREGSGVRRTPQGDPYDQMNLEELARRAKTTTRNLRRYAYGETSWIELDIADRLAMALGIPLCMLADEFKPKGQTVCKKVAA